MIIAKDLMSGSPKFLRASDKLSDAIVLFENKQFRTLPVVDSQNQILGILSEMCLLKCLIVAKAQNNFEIQLLQFSDQLEKPHLVNDRDPVEKVMAMLMQAASNRLLVVDSQGHLTGVISPKDLIFYFIAKDRKAGNLQKKVETLEEELHRLQDANQKLLAKQKSVEDYDDIIQNGLFLFHRVGLDGVITIANKRLHEVLGYNDGELLGRPVTTLYPEHLHDSIANELQAEHTPGKLEVVYSTFQTKNGHAIKVELTSSAVLDTGGVCEGMATVSRIIDSDVMLRLLSGAITYKSES